MATKITLTEAAAVAIQALQHKNGTFSYYSSNLRRISNSILYLSDEMGMSDSETVETLRVLDSVRRDLAAIADIDDCPVTATVTDGEDVRRAIQQTFGFVDLSANDAERVRDIRDYMATAKKAVTTAQMEIGFAAQKLGTLVETTSLKDSFDDKLKDLRDRLASIEEEINERIDEIDYLRISTNEQSGDDDSDSPVDEM